jgi:hypothetical protein
MVALRFRKRLSEHVHEEVSPQRNAMLQLACIIGAVTSLMLLRSD